MQYRDSNHKRVLISTAQVIIAII